MRQSCEIAERLATSAMQTDDAEAWAVADMLRLVSRPENIFTADDLHNQDGEAFEGYGSLVMTGSRLDPAYMAASRRKARVRVRQALGQVKPRSGEHLRMLTVTMPAINGFALSLDVLDGALVLLKKRGWFKENVRGAVLGVEFTVGDAGGHYHIHAHILAWSKWIKWADFGRVWTECLQASAEKLGAQIEFGTSHGRAVVDVRLVRPRQDRVKNWQRKGVVGMDDAIEEVCKYVVKGSDFLSVPVDELATIERVLRRRRMLETFGEANGQRGRAVQPLDAPDALESETSLDTQAITDGDATQETVTRERSEPLRLIGAQMIREGRRKEWLEYLEKVFKTRQRWRKRQLVERYPCATFRDLVGNVWYGLAVAPENCVGVS